MNHVGDHLSLLGFLEESFPEALEIWVIDRRYRADLKLCLHAQILARGWQALGLGAVPWQQLHKPRSTSLPIFVRDR